jgi:hypothetical protein
MNMVTFRNCLRIVLLLAHHLVMIIAYLTFDHESGRTGIKRELHWKQFTKPVPLAVETKLVKSDVLSVRGEFGPLSESRQLELELECYALGITRQQGHCMRFQQLLRKVITNSGKLRDKKLLRRLSREFEHGRTSLLALSRELDLPPISIFRAIMRFRLESVHNIRYKREMTRILKSIIYGDGDLENVSEFLSQHEFEQMQVAKQNDIVGYASYQNSIVPQEWENKVFSYLDDNEINYIPESKLRHADASSTPDCLILDDLHINNELVRWIEVKCSFASGLKDNKYMQKKTLIDQVKRYNSEFGKGAVVLKNGFSDTMITKLSNTLLLDGGPLMDSNTLMP